MTTRRSRRPRRRAGGSGRLRHAPARPQAPVQLRKPDARQRRRRSRESSDRSRFACRPRMRRTGGRRPVAVHHAEIPIFDITLGQPRLQRLQGHRFAIHRLAPRRRRILRIGRKPPRRLQTSATDKPRPPHSRSARPAWWMSRAIARFHGQAAAACADPASTSVRMHRTHVIIAIGTGSRSCPGVWLAPRSLSSSSLAPPQHQLHRLPAHKADARQLPRAYSSGANTQRQLGQAAMRVRMRKRSRAQCRQSGARRKKRRRQTRSPAAARFSPAGAPTAPAACAAKHHHRLTQRVDRRVGHLRKPAAGKT